MSCQAEAPSFSKTNSAITGGYFLSHYDVIIVGGGISGLLIASQLAGRASVLVLEREQRLPEHKYWLTDKASCLQHPELSTYIDTEYECMRFIAYDGTSATTEGPYVLWDTGKLVNGLAEGIEVLGGEISTGTSFYTYAESTSHLTVCSNRGVLTCRLMIDCTGHASPIASAKGLLETIGFFALYGCELQRKAAFAPVGLHNVMLEQHPTYFEAFPNSRGTVHATIIKPVYETRHSADLHDTFRFVVNQTEYADLFHPVPDEITTRRHYGIVPIAKLRRRSLNRILLFGEAGQDNPATSATTLSRLFCNYKQIADFLVDRLRSNRLDAASLRIPRQNQMSRFNVIFQRQLFQSLLRFRSDDFRQLVRELELYPCDVVNELIFGRFTCTPRQFLSIIGRAAGARSFLLARHFVTAGFRAWPLTFWD